MLKISKILTVLLVLALVFSVISIVFVFKQELDVNSKLINYYKSREKVLLNRINALYNSLNASVKIIETYENLTSTLNNEIKLLKSLLNLSVSLLIVDTKVTLYPLINLTYHVNSTYAGYINVLISDICPNAYIIVRGRYLNKTYVFKSCLSDKQVIIPVLPGKITINIFQIGGESKRIRLIIKLVY